MSDHVPGRGISIETLEEAEKLAVPRKTEDLLKSVDRITSKFIIHLENCCDKTQSVDKHFSALLKSQGVQLYDRKVKVKKDWTPLDLGWIPQDAEVGFIVVENLTDRNNLRRIQMLAPDGKPLPPNLLISISGNDQEPDFIIEPAQYNVFTPARAHLWRLKSSGDDFFANISIFPR